MSNFNWAVVTGTDDRMEKERVYREVKKERKIIHKFAVSSLLQNFQVIKES